MWLIWHVFHVVPIYFFTLGLSDFAAYLRNHSSRYFTVFVLFLLYFTLILSVTYDTFFSGMAKSHGVLTGFLHGPIYDNLILIDNGVLRIQYFHTIIAISVFLCTVEIRSILPRRKQMLQIAIAISTLLSTGFLINQTDYLSSIKKSKNIVKVLDEKIPLKIADIYTDKKTAQSRAFAELLPQIDFHLTDLYQILEIKPKSKILIYVYHDSIMKKKIFGGHHTDVTDVLTPAIHISADNFPHRTLRHELIHAMLSDIAYYGIGFHPNMAITEGIAVALDNNNRIYNLHQAAGYLIKEDKISDPIKIFSPLFWLESSRSSYSVAGSILSFIIDKYGIKKAIRLYSGESWEDVFDEDSQAIINDWKSFVLSQYDADKQKIFKKRIFSQKGVLFEKCPHTKASLTLDSENSLLFHPSDFQGKINRNAYLIKNFPNQKNVQVIKLNKDINKESYSDQDLEKLIKNEISTIEDIQTNLLITDQYVLLKKYDRAKKILKMLKDFTEKSHVGNHLSSSTHLRILLLTSNHPDRFIWYQHLSGKLKEVEVPQPQAPWVFAMTYLVRAKVKPTSEYLSNFSPDERTNLSLQYLWYKKRLELAHSESKIQLGKKILDEIDKKQLPLNKKHLNMMIKYFDFLEKRKRS